LYISQNCKDYVSFTAKHPAGANIVVPGQDSVSCDLQKANNNKCFFKESSPRARETIIHNCSLFPLSELENRANIQVTEKNKTQNSTRYWFKKILLLDFAHTNLLFSKLKFVIWSLSGMS